MVIHFYHKSCFRKSIIICHPSTASVLSLNVKPWTESSKRLWVTVMPACRSLSLKSSASLHTESRPAVNISVGGNNCTWSNSSKNRRYQRIFSFLFAFAVTYIKYSAHFIRKRTFWLRLKIWVRENI